MDPSEFEVIFQTYYPQVYRRVYYLVGERGTAEDLTQEVFLKLYHRPLRDKSNIGGWLMKVAANMSYNYLRGEERRRRREESQALTSSGSIISLEEAVIRNQDARQVHNCLARLSARDRLCLLLKNVGYSYAEIADIIQVDKNSVGTILARARKNFAEVYRQYEGRDDSVPGRGYSPSLS